MHKLIFVLAVIVGNSTYAQNIGIGTTNPASSALLDVSANNKGVLIPRLTNTEMTTGIASPVEGLMVYNTTVKKLFFYNGSQWQAVSALSDSSWSINGNANTIPDTHFFGTTDDKDLVLKRGNLRAGLVSGLLFGNTSWGIGALNPATTGSNNTATGRTALQNNSSGSANTATGFQALQNNSTGNGNTAIGSNALVLNNGNRNTALGYRSAENNNAGSYNVFIGNEAGFNEAGSNKLYISNSSADAANALIYGEFDTKKLSLNGAIGIGILSAGFPLEIKGTGANSELIKLYDNTGAAKWHLDMTSGYLNFGETGVAENRLLLRTGGEAGIGKIPLATNDDSRLQIKQKGIQNGFGIEAAASTNHWDFYVTTTPSDLVLYLNGVLKGTFSNVNGAYTMASDRRLKKDISTHLPALNGLMQLQAYRYHYLDNKPTDNFTNGFMAQDVQKVFPDAVVEMEMKDGEKRLGINYQYFTVLAVKGLQDQQKIIDSQEERLKKLEAQVQTLMQKK